MKPMMGCGGKPERAIGVLVLGPVERDPTSARGGAASVCQPEAAMRRPRKKPKPSTPIESRSHHTISAEQEVAGAVDQVPQRTALGLAAHGADDVGAAVEQQHEAGRDHQAAERERGLKGDQRAGEHRKDAAAVMGAAAVGIPGVGELDDAGQKDRQADDRHAPHRREQRRDRRDRAEHEQQNADLASRRAALSRGSYLT